MNVRKPTARLGFEVTCLTNKTQVQKKDNTKLHAYISTCPAASDPFSLSPVCTYSEPEPEPRKKKEAQSLALTRVSTLPHRIITTFLIGPVSFRSCFPAPPGPSLPYPPPCDSASCRIPKTNNKPKRDPSLIHDASQHKGTCRIRKKRKLINAVIFVVV